MVVAHCKSVQEKAREVLVGILDSILDKPEDASQKNEIMQRFISKGQDDDCIGSYLFADKPPVSDYGMPLHLAEAFVKRCREVAQLGQPSFYR
jgi:hypothetical protein